MGRELPALRGAAEAGLREPEGRVLEWLIGHRAEWAGTVSVAQGARIGGLRALRALRRLENWGLVERWDERAEAAQGRLVERHPRWRLIPLADLERQARAARAAKMLREFEQWGRRWRPLPPALEGPYRRLLYAALTTAFADDRRSGGAPPEPGPPLPAGRRRPGVESMLWGEAKGGGR